MREISTNQITAAIRDLCIKANTQLGEDVLAAFHKAIKLEVSPTGKDILAKLVENARIAREEEIPICQDTGFAVIFVELGQEVHLIGGDLKEAINEGVRQGYLEGYLRKSICHPFTRKNTGDNTPAVIHFDIVPGDRVRLIVAPKGGGSENMSRVTMLTPAVGIQGVKDFVVQRIKESGANPCPPTIVGVGIGGTFETAALLAKRALLRPLGSQNPNAELASLEAELYEKINALGIGAAGVLARQPQLRPGPPRLRVRPVAERHPDRHPHRRQPQPCQ